MNEEQKDVLELIYCQCLSNRPGLSLVEGPPGTGKTRLIVNLILQLVFGKEVQRRLRILVCASSNAAVDNIALKLMKIRKKTSPAGAILIAKNFWRQTIEANVNFGFSFFRETTNA